MRKIIVTLLILTYFAVACAPSSGMTSTQDSPDLVQTIVAATFAALTPGDATDLIPTATLVQPLATPTSTFATVSGAVCYPSGIPANIVAYFQETTTNKVTELSIGAGQGSYEVELSPGTYIAYAWKTDYSIGGSYSACGATAGCGSATPLSFTVRAGETVTGIDLCDWSHGPFDVPYPPGFQPVASLSNISGNVSGYPYGSLPRLTIVAFNQDTHYWYWVGTAAGQSYFSFTELPPGKYQVVAYDDAGHAGGASVTLSAGQNASVVISDWTGSYPANPVK